MTDRHFRAWLVKLFGEKEADSIERDERRRAHYAAHMGFPVNFPPPRKSWRWLAVHEEHHAPPASPEVERFCADLQQQWRKK